MNAASTTDVRQHILDVAKPLMLAKGFTGVGLAEILAAAEVPKGSFYHYFGSKEAFGEAVLDAYFSETLARTDALLSQPGSSTDRLMAYLNDWLSAQIATEGAQSRCLAVKLGAEVCDLSEKMRSALERGTNGLIARITRCLEEGRADGSFPVDLDSKATAAAIYQTWLGASLLAKISRNRAPLDIALAGTRQQLNLPAT